MQIPIQYALTYPERRAIPGTELDLAAVGQLSFETPDRKRFPSLDFAHEAVRRGSTAPAVLNAANEVAVDLFLKGRLSFLRIFEVVGKVLAAHRTPADEPQLETVLAADRWAREEVRSRL
jgi:1-deoxy-D-xylulose-5-phosphate reductoisomerase